MSAHLTVVWAAWYPIFAPAPGRNGAPKTKEGNDAMAWSTPEVREVCVGMEVTSYLSAEM
jgi:coenzyme PQQ precursor peptide PqqA